MMVLITYDVNTETAAGRKRLRRVAKQCLDCGQRVQKSVFECLVDPVQFARLRKNLNSTIDLDLDSIRYYFLGSNWKNRVEHVGVETSYDPEGVLLV
jgi:CRISPR-associated protein Cas2